MRKTRPSLKENDRKKEGGTGITPLQAHFLRDMTGGGHLSFASDKSDGQVAGEWPGVMGVEWRDMSCAA